MTDHIRTLDEDGNLRTPADDEPRFTLVEAKKELILPTYDETSNARADAAGELIYITGNGGDTEGIYKYDGGSYKRTVTGLEDGENFDGQGTSEFSNLANVVTDDQTVNQTLTDPDGVDHTGELADDADVYSDSEAQNAVDGANVDIAGDADTVDGKHASDIGKSTAEIQEQALAYSWVIN
jgi:hypothetical protein